MRTLLVLLALLCAGIAALFGFEVIHSAHPHTGGWVSLSFALYLGSLLVDQ